MLVNFKRPFFSPSGNLIPKGTQEYNGPEDQLPRDAVVVSKEGHLPVMSNTPKPGHGAKPVEEQILDMIPGAGLTHQIDTTPTPEAPALSEEERKELEKANADAAAKGDDERVKAAEKKDADLAADVAKALPAAKEAAERLSLATDSLSPFAPDEKAKGKK